VLLIEWFLDDKHAVTVVLVGPPDIWDEFEGVGPPVTCVWRERGTFTEELTLLPFAFCHCSHPLHLHFELKLWQLKSTGLVSCLYETGLANGAKLMHTIEAPSQLWLRFTELLPPPDKGCWKRNGLPSFQLQPRAFHRYAVCTLWVHPPTSGHSQSEAHHHKFVASDDCNFSN